MSIYRNISFTYQVNKTKGKYEMFNKLGSINSFFLEVLPRSEYNTSSSEKKTFLRENFHKLSLSGFLQDIKFKKVVQDNN